MGGAILCLPACLPACRVALARQECPWHGNTMSVLASLRLSRAPAAAFVVLGLHWGAFAAYVPQIKSKIGASDALFGTLLLGSAIGLMSAMWLAPRVDRWLGARGLALATAMFSATFLLLALASGPVSFALAMVAVGCASGLADVVMNARVSELEAQHRRSLMNVNHAMFSVAYAIIAISCGVAREWDVSAFSMFAAIGLVVLWLTTLMTQAPAAQPDHDVGRAASGYPLGPIVLCGVVVLIAFMAEAAVETWSALYIERSLLGGAAEGALGPAMLGATMAVGRFAGQALTDMIKETSLLVLAAVLAAGGLVVAALAGQPAVAYAGFGIFGLGVSVIAPMGLALVGQLVSPARRTQAISRVAVIGFSGFFLAPVAMGVISEVLGLRVAFLAVALMLSPVPVLAVLLARRHRTSREAV
jgi:MFS family permease